MSSERASYTFRIISGYTFDPEDDNIDVEVRLDTGERYIPTFVTPRNIRRIMDNHRASGESRGGAYFWMADMIIVERLTEDYIRAAIDDLFETNSLARFFSGPSDLHLYALADADLLPDDDTLPLEQVLGMLSLDQWGHLERLRRLGDKRGLPFRFYGANRWTSEQVNSLLALCDEMFAREENEYCRFVIEVFKLILGKAAANGVGIATFCV